MDRHHSSTKMITSENTDDIKHIFSGIMKQIQEELSSLDSSHPSGSSNKQVQSGLKELSTSVSSLASVKSSDLLTKHDDLKKTIGQIFSKFSGKKDQKETAENLTKSLSDAICKHLQEKCQPDIQKINKYTSSQAESLLSCSSVGSSVLHGASSVLQGASSSTGESVLNQLVTFGKKVKKITSSEGQPTLNTTLKKLAVQPFKKSSDLSVGKTVVEELSKDLKKVFHSATEGSSNSPGSADVVNQSSFQNKILEKVVNNMVSKMVMEKFPKSVTKEIHSDQESHKSLSSPIKRMQDMIVEKITDNLFSDESSTAKALSAVGISGSKKTTGTKVKGMIQDCALQAVKKTFSK